MIPLSAFWSRPGVMMVRADAATVGPSESIPAIAALGYGWIAGDPKTGEWGDERRLAKANGLAFLPWTRVRTAGDLVVLADARQRWGSAAVLPNVEIPDTRDPTFMGQVAVALSRAGRGIVPTDGWTDPAGYWKPLSRWVLAPECFPQENPAYKDVKGCVAHAQTLTRRECLPLLGAYGVTWKGRLPVRGDYDWPAGAAFVVYPGDTVRDWADWAPTWTDAA